MKDELLVFAFFGVLLALAYHVALNGKPQGPFPPATLASMAAAGSIDAHTLVWRPGLAGWGAAGVQADLKPLFPEEPPPLP